LKNDKNKSSNFAKKNNNNATLFQQSWFRKYL
jgi:hypothetical protein